MQKCKTRVKEIKNSGTPICLLTREFASRAASVLGYIGQLVSLPRNITTLEVWAAHKAMGIPLGLECNAIYDLGKFGSVKLLRIANYIRACMLRTAMTTVKGHLEMHNALKQAAVRGTVFAQWYSGCLRPPGWDSDAFATNLANASLGLGLGVDLHASSTSSLFIKLQTNAMNNSTSSNRKSRQAAFYDHLQSLSNFRCDWTKVLTKKLSFCETLLPLGWSLDEMLVDRVAVCLNKLGIRTATALIKTWSNTWATSSRMHEDRRMSCIFGCQADDALEHYLVCDPLWTAVISNTFKRVELLYADPFTKLGMCENSSEWCQMMSVAFSCYHALKFSHMDDIRALLDNGHPSKVETRLFNYASAHAKDIIR